MKTLVPVIWRGKRGGRGRIEAKKGKKIPVIGDWWLDRGGGGETWGRPTKGGGFSGDLKRKWKRPIRGGKQATPKNPKGITKKVKWGGGAGGRKKKIRPRRKKEKKTNRVQEGKTEPKGRWGEERNVINVGDQQKTRGEPREAFWAGKKGHLTEWGGDAIKWRKKATYN